MELDAIAAVVIGGTLLTGGTGYVLGSVLGVLVLGIDPDLHRLRRHPQLLVDQDRHRRPAPRLHPAAAALRPESRLTLYLSRTSRTSSPARHLPHVERTFSA